MIRSVEPTPAAVTRTRNSPGPGCSMGSSTRCRTLGPPAFVNITARYVAAISVLIIGVCYLAPHAGKGTPGRASFLVLSARDFVSPGRTRHGLQKGGTRHSPLILGTPLQSAASSQYRVRSPTPRYALRGAGSQGSGLRTSYSVRGSAAQCFELRAANLYERQNSMAIASPLNHERGGKAHSEVNSSFCND